MSGTGEIGNRGQGRPAETKRTHRVREGADQVKTAIKEVRSKSKKSGAGSDSCGYRKYEIHVSGPTVSAFATATGLDYGPARTSKFLKERLGRKARVAEVPPAWSRNAGLPAAERYVLVGESWVFCLNWGGEAWQTGEFACLEQVGEPCGSEGRAHLRRKWNRELAECQRRADSRGWTS